MRVEIMTGISIVLFILALILFPLLIFSTLVFVVLILAKCVAVLLPFVILALALFLAYVGFKEGLENYRRVNTFHRITLTNHVVWGAYATFVSLGVLAGIIIVITLCFYLETFVIGTILPLTLSPYHFT